MRNSSITFFGLSKIRLLSCISIRKIFHSQSILFLKLLELSEGLKFIRWKVWILNLTTKISFIFQKFALRNRKFIINRFFFSKYLKRNASFFSQISYPNSTSNVKAILQRNIYLIVCLQNSFLKTFDLEKRELIG